MCQSHDITAESTLIGLSNPLSLINMRDLAISLVFFLILSLLLPGSLSFRAGFHQSIAFPSSTKASLSYHRTLSQIQVSTLYATKKDSLTTSETSEEVKEPTAFEKVASVGLAGVLAIAVAESIFWALGMPLAEIWYKVTTGEWIDLMTTDGQLKAAGFSFGYGGFATVILQYRVTLFAIPLIPIMDKYVVTPAKKIFGDQIDQAKKSQ